MGVHDIYGLGGSTGGDSEPADANEPAVEGGPELAESEPSATTESDAGKLSATAVASASIDQLLNSHRPISSSVHFSESDTDTGGKPNKKRAPKAGWLSRIIGTGAGEPVPKPAPEPLSSASPEQAGPAPEAPVSADSEASDETAEPSVKSVGLLRTRHWVIGGGILVVVLSCALVGGLMTAMRDAPTPPATAQGQDTVADLAGPDEPSKQTDRPLPMTIEPPVCWTPSNDVENAIKGKEDVAFRCTPPWNADGTRIVIHLTGGPYRIAKARMVGGWDYTSKDNVDQWCQYRTISIATWRFDDSKPYEQMFDGSREQQSKEIPDEIYASTVTLQITKTTVPKCGTSPAATSAPPGIGLPGLPGGWGTINLPSPGTEPGKASGGQSSGDPKAFAISFLQILGHKPS